MEFPRFIDLLKQAWQIYKANFKLFLRLFALALLAIILTVVVGFLSAMVFVAAGPQNAEWPPVFVALAVVLVAMFVLAIIAIQVLAQVSAILVVKQFLEGKKEISARKIVGQAKKFILPIVGISLLTAFLATGGIVLFVVPGIIFSIWFSFAYFILIAENKRGFEALLASRDYMRGYMSIVIVRWILYTIATWVITYVPSYMLNQLKLSALSSIYSSVVGILLAPLSLIFGFLLYAAVRARKGEIQVDLSRSRKLKYLAVAGLGYLLIIGLVIYLSRNFM